MSAAARVNHVLTTMEEITHDAIDPYTSELPTSLLIRIRDLPTPEDRERLAMIREICLRSVDPTRRKFALAALLKVGGASETPFLKHYMTHADRAGAEVLTLELRYWRDPEHISLAIDLLFQRPPGERPDHLVYLSHYLANTVPHGLALSEEQRRALPDLMAACVAKYRDILPDCLPAQERLHLFLTFDPPVSPHQPTGKSP